MKRTGSIIIAFYLIVLIYILYVNPMVVVWCMFALLITLGITTFVRDVLIPKIKKLWQF